MSWNFDDSRIGAGNYIGKYIYFRKFQCFSSASACYDSGSEDYYQEETLESLGE